MIKIDFTREKDILAALDKGRLKVLADGDDRHQVITRRSNSKSTEVEHILGGTVYRVPNENITEEEPCVYYNFDKDICNESCILFSFCKKSVSDEADTSFVKHLDEEISLLEPSIITRAMVENAAIIHDPDGREIRVFQDATGKYQLFRHKYPTDNAHQIVTRFLKKLEPELDTTLMETQELLEYFETYIRMQEEMG